MTAQAHAAGIQLSLLGPNIGLCVGAASTEAATARHEAHAAPDTAAISAPATTAHRRSAQQEGSTGAQAPGFAERIGQRENSKRAERTAGPVRSRAELPQGSVLSARWEPFAVVAARRPGMAPKRVRALLERLYTAGVAERAVYGETGVELWRLADAAGARR